MKPDPDETIVISPFVVIVDNMEQAPWRFSAMETDDGQPLTVPLITNRHLATGDYSIDGLETQITIERKSHADYLGSVGRDRERFEREMERMKSYRFAAVVIEASWSELMQGLPGQSQVGPRVAMRTAFSWSIRYGVHFFAMPGRRTAEVAAYRLLEMFWRQEQRTMKTLGKALETL